MSKYTPKILFINHNSLPNLTNIYEKYDRVIFYDDKYPYATRMLNCMLQLNYDYILLIHDIDILLHINEQVCSNLIKIMMESNIDRIDLKHSSVSTLDRIIPLNNNCFLVKTNDPHSYPYNVNPSIWKRESFIELLSNFKHKGYRDIEQIDVQTFSLKYNIYKIYSPEYIKCGYYDCVNFFKFLHISHAGKILFPDEKCRTIHNQSYMDVKSELQEITSKYFK
jgi:hypothetical protein